MTNTYKLWELSSSREEIHQLASQVAESWHGDIIKSRINEWDDEASTLAYAVHAEFWRVSSPDFPHPPYTRSTKGLSLIKALARAIPDIDRLFTSARQTSLTRKLYASLAHADLLIRLGQTSGFGATYFVREWPPGFQVEWASRGNAKYIPLKDRPDLNRQDRKAVAVAGPVETHFDIKTISLPDPNPESVMEYLHRVIPLVIHLQDENQELRQKIKELDAAKWTEVTNLIKETAQ